jgi:hypothetical protein
MAHQTEALVHGTRVSFIATFSSTSWERQQIRRSTLRVLDEGLLSESCPTLAWRTKGSSAIGTDSR